MPRQRAYGSIALVGLIWLVPALALAWSPFWSNGFCESSGRNCRSTIGNAGGANACCDPLNPDVSSCVQSDPCTGTAQQRWPMKAMPLKWYFNANEQPGKPGGFFRLTTEKIEKDLKLAWDAWTKPKCTSFRHKYEGKTKNPADSFDGKITIHLASEAEWAKLGVGFGGILAFAVWRSKEQGEIYDGDVIVNPKPGNGFWGVTPVEINQYDLTMVLSHEIGHVLGFGHTPGTSDLMFFAIRSTGPNFKGIGGDEKTAICATYPATNACQSSADCATCYACSQGTCGPANPARPTLCKPCKEDADCGENSLCVDSEAGGRCVQKCSATSKCCPDGYRCHTVESGAACFPREGQCPAIKCTDDASCGRDATCKGGTCQTTKTPAFNASACAKTCKSDSDCTKGATCQAMASGLSKCLNSCIGGRFCPSGYGCRKLPSRKEFCVPHFPDLCPCTGDADCAKGQVCAKGQCRPEKFGQEGSFCHDNLPCQKGFRCTQLLARQCLRECVSTKCPEGRVCKSFSVNIKLCVGPEEKLHGSTCDGVINRCRAGLVCVLNGQGTTKGVCIQQCQGLRNCPTGDLCVRARSGVSHCGCNVDADCKLRGLVCKDFGGYKMCACDKPPCKNFLCGNLICDRGAGENCSTCAKDCICDKGFSCTEGKCVPGEGVCVATDDNLKCDANDPGCKPTCETSGCGCDASGPTAPLPFFLLLIGLLVIRRR